MIEEDHIRHLDITLRVLEQQQWFAKMSKSLFPHL